MATRQNVTSLKTLNNDNTTRRRFNYREFMLWAESMTSTNGRSPNGRLADCKLTVLSEHFHQALLCSRRSTNGCAIVKKTNHVPQSTSTRGFSSPNAVESSGPQHQLWLGEGEERALLGVCGTS